MFLPGQKFVQRAYGMHCQGAEPTQGGLSALAYFVKSSEGTFFLKVYPGGQAGSTLDTAHMTARLTALADMEKNSSLQGHLCPAGAGAEEELFAPQNGDVYLLFPALVGERPRFGTRLEKETARELGRLCRALHELDPALFGQGLPGSGAVTSSPSQVMFSYLKITLGTALLRALRTLARAEGGARFFCGAGKNRTGVMGAVLLMLCEVLDEEIEADHLLSKENLMPEQGRFARQIPGVDLRVSLALQ